MKGFGFLTIIAMLLLIAWVSVGCSNADNLTQPSPPDPGVNDQQGNALDPDIPVPFADTEFGRILDFAFEKDGDLAISDEGQGILLFDNFGDLKRNISEGSTPWTGMIDVGPGWLDSGRGVIATGPSIKCAWTSFYDDKYVSGGTAFPSPAGWWWDGEAHPLPECSLTATSGEFDCSDFTPTGIDLHPIHGWLFIKIEHTKVNTDPDCGFEPDQVPERDMGDGILAVHPSAPLLGAELNYYEGGADYIVYHNKSDVDAVDAYGFSMASAAVGIFNWDETNPFTMLPPRDGISTGNISDFEFDAYGRLIVVVPNGNSFAITDPVVPPEMIVVQRIIGGAQDGTSHAPGDFYGPRGVAVDPRNQEIYITDTGLNRVQVFDNQGNFIRMFGTDIGGQGLDLTAPTAIEIDSFGNVYIAVANEPHLVVVNEYGQPISYGSIEGYVFDKMSGVPLDNVVVSIASTYREFLTLTDEQGFFRFQSVPQGDHTLIANRPGYEAGYSGMFVTGGYKTTVSIYMERTAVGSSGIGDITGKLMSSLDGDPLSGLLVTVKGFGITDTTTSDGTFHLYNVPEGDHVMQVLSDSTVLYEQDIHVNSDDITPLGYIYLPI
jgi:hypothetical protein